MNPFKFSLTSQLRVAVIFGKHIIIIILLVCTDKKELEMVGLVNRTYSFISPHSYATPSPPILILYIF